MARGTKKASEPVLNYEAKLWQMADALPNYKCVAECKHVVLHLVSLKHSWAAPSSTVEMARARVANPLSEWPSPFHSISRQPVKLVA